MRRSDAFELWSWRRLLRVPWTARRANPKGDQSWVFIGRTDIEAETPILWSPDAKDPDAGKDWRWEEMGTTEGEMVGWHHQLNGHEFKQALGVGYRQGSLECCSPWGFKESDTTEQLLWTEWDRIRRQSPWEMTKSWERLPWTELIPLQKTHQRVFLPHV